MPLIPPTLEAKDFSCMIPHKGPMMLLDKVDSWDEKAIICSAISHNSETNPLRVNGRLSYIHIIEYGAQAAAIHLAITAIESNTPMSGYSKLTPITSAYLAVTRNFTFEQGFLDEHPGTRLILKSEVISVGPRIYQYHITGSIEEKVVAEGVVSLVTDEVPE